MAAGAKRSPCLFLMRPKSPPLDLARQCVADRLENRDDALVRIAHALAVAAASRLRDLVQPCFGAEDTREIHVDAGFDKRRGDQPARKAAPQPRANIFQDLAAVRRIVPCGEMQNAVEPGRDRLPIKVQRMGAAVHDDERLLLAAKHVHQRRVIHGPRECQPRSPQFAGKASRVRRQLPAIEGQAREAIAQT